MSTHGKLCRIEITFRQDYWVDTDQIHKNNFNDKIYDLTPIDLIFMLKIYQEEDFDFLDHEGTKLNKKFSVITIQRIQTRLISVTDYGLLNFVALKDELNMTSNTVSTHNRKTVHWLLFIHTDHLNFDLTVNYENCAIWNYARFSTKLYKRLHEMLSLHEYMGIKV